MEKYYHPDDIRHADVVAVEKFGIPSLTLMENAGTNAANVMLNGFPSARRFLILAGRGNNGGDGFVAARVLLNAGKSVTVIKSAQDEKYKGDALYNLTVLRGMASDDLSMTCSEELTDDEAAALVDRSDCVVDAILGTGTSGAPRGEAARLIALCRKRGATVAFDIPSGIDPESGGVHSPCVRADVTVTFLAPKWGMSSYPAREMCGRIVTAGIGAEPSDVLAGALPLLCFDRKDISSMKPRFGRAIHKGDRGGVLIFGGSRAYRGAPLLAALGALRAGAGLAVLAIPDYMVDGAATLLPEAVFAPLETKNMEIIPNKAFDAAAPWLERCSSAVLGPGIGRSDAAGEVVNRFCADCAKPFVVDADALYFFRGAANRLGRIRNAVVTPHLGEAARVLGLDAESVSSDRNSAVTELAKFAGTALLKGSGTLISDGSEIRKILEGSPSLAVPGSGDVLSGVIGAFLASGMKPLDAASLGALVHAAAGGETEKEHGTSGALAREIADEIRRLLR